MIRNRLDASDAIQALTRAAQAAVNEVRTNAFMDLKQMIGIQGPPRSLPGNPPHMDTTRLNMSLDSVMYAGEGIVGATIGEDTPYALALEFGYPENNLAPRPHQSTEMNKVAAEATPVVTRIMGGAINART